MSVLSRWAHRTWSSAAPVAVGALLAACASAPSGAGSNSASAPAGVGAAATERGGVPSGCLLLVRGLSAPTVGQAPGVYTGAFLVLRVEDGQVRGEGGDFYSEGYDVRGKAGPGGMELQMGTPTEPTGWKPLALEWIPERETFDGWQRVGLADMREFSGGGVPSRRSDCRDVEVP